MKSFKEILMENIYDKSSNWYKFSKYFDLYNKEMNVLARALGYKNFDDLNISISPRGMFKKDANKFAQAVQQVATTDEIHGKEDKEIIKILKKLL